MTFVEALQRLTRTGAFARPRFCARCGRRYVEKTYHAGFSRRDGSAVFRTFKACPGRRRAPDYDDLDRDCWPPPPSDEA